jgi:hypothetical protein
MRKYLPLLAIALLAFSNIMCGFGAYDSDSEHFTRTKPESTKLAGVYRPTTETWKLINEMGHYNVQDISLTLLPDGTFKMINMPDWWHTDFGESFGGTDSGKGKWSLSQQNDWWEIELSFNTTIFNSDPSLSGNFVTWPVLSEEQQPYSLRFYVGDPDDGRVMIFQQVVNKQ